MWAPQSVWLIEECDWDLRYSRLQARRRGVPQAADSGSLPRDFQALLWYSPRTTPAARPHLLTQVHKHQLLVSCGFSCHKTPPYLIAPLKRTRCSSLQLICLVSLQLVDLICWRCIYKLKALRFRHTPCSSFNEHLFSSLLSIYFCLWVWNCFPDLVKGSRSLWRCPGWWARYNASLLLPLYKLLELLVSCWISDCNMSALSAFWDN